MNRHLLQKVKMFAMALPAITAFILSGCEGDTGPAGPPGAPATFGSAACDDCHHLNDLPVQEFAEQFVSGLAGDDQEIASASSTTLAFVPDELPEGEEAQSFQWMHIGGLESTIISGATSSVAIVTLPTVTDYKDELVKHVMGLMVTMPPEESEAVGSDRAAVVPINPFSLEEAITAEYKLRVATKSGKYYYSLVKVTDATGLEEVRNFGAVNGGIRNVPVNVPVLFRAATSSGYTWMITSPTGSVLSANTGSNPQFAYFTPVEPGEYAISQTTGTTSEITIFAGTWRGAISGVDANNDPIPDSACTGCHDGSPAPDKFTPWKVSGHAEIFTQNLNAGGHYGEGCLPCHTVGFDTNPAAVNNGFDDQTGFAEFIGSSFYFASSRNDNRYRQMWTDYPDMARRTNVQCENCHGPQEMGEGVNSDAHGNSSARTSLSSDVCATCHGEPLRHSRFQQWQSSGHANYELAVLEATVENRAATAGHCGRCHSAQGFIQWITQSNLTQRISSTVTGTTNATVAELTALGLTADTVHPQTCAVCHDPHAQGNTSGEPNTATVRITGETPKLPSGFVATSMGRGAVCITCHNTRNGASGNDAFLHQDGDPVFGTLTSYAAPHTSAQGDVLLGYNAYFVGNVNNGYRSPHAIINDTCATCHMEQTPPPPLLSYNLSGTNHTFKASLGICVNCHPGNLSFGFIEQSAVHSSLEVLAEDILDRIISRNTGTPIVEAELTESGGQPAIAAVFDDDSTATVRLNDLPGVKVADFGSDVLAKAVWNFLLIESDESFGIHNPDFVRAVLAATQAEVNNIPDEVQEGEL